MLKPGISKSLGDSSKALLVRASMLLLLFGFWGARTAYAQLSITPTTWNVIGLDSNRVNDGPDTYPVGARVCNTSGAALNNVVSNLIWDSSNIYINLTGGSTLSARVLAAGACTDFYYDVTITRTSSAYNTTRRYHITATADGVGTVSTPTPREVYVEKLVSQSRNTIRGITGPTTVYVGNTYTYIVDAETAPGGYEQLEAFLSLTNVIFRVERVQTTYTSPTGATNNKFYADACGWNNDPTSPSYKSCTGPENYSGGKAGDVIRTIYTVRVLSTGTTTISSMIHDFSGSSYHYNADFGQRTISVTALPAPIILSKTADQALMSAGGAVKYTLRLANSSSYDIVINDFVDTLPSAPGSVSYSSGSSTFNGAAIADPTINGSTLTWNAIFLIPAGQTRELQFQASLANVQGTYLNRAVAHLEYTQIDATADPNDNTPATASVVIRFPPKIDLTKSYSANTTFIQPGTEITYPISFTNSGGTGAASLIIKDIIPPNTEFKVGSTTYDLGTTGLSAAPTIQYTNLTIPNPDPTLPPLPPADNDPSWSYQPTGTYDSNVKFVRWVFSGSIPPQTSGNVAFIVRIR
jgi:uncharacterized repeat protein (TIGR01451 family)